MGNSRRTTEGALLLFASVILLLGFLLVFLAKLPELKIDGTVDINTARPDKIASALRIDPGLAKLVVKYRDEHGFFTSTESICDVKLLTEKQVAALMHLLDKKDIRELSPGELSRDAGLTDAVASRLVDVLATRSEGARMDTAHLSTIPAIGFDTFERADSSLRVREPKSVIFGFWLYAALLVIGFILLHMVLRKSAPQADPFILPSAFMLAGLGAIILFSIKHPLRDTNVFPAQVQGILLGLLVSVIPLTARYKEWKPWRYTYIFALSAFFLTLLLTLFGTGPGGARLRIFGFQPVELTKLALLFFVASYLSDHWSILADRSGPKRKIQMPLFRDIGPLAVMYILSLATFVLVRDMGPMLVLFGMFVVMLYVATGKPSFVAVGLAGVGISAWVMYMLKLGVFSTRVDMWLHPWSNAHSNGMQLGQALWGFSSGGIWGSGLGLGHPDFMSRAGSDLVFASLGEELGLIGSIFIFVLLAVLIARGFKAALHAHTDFERFIASGVTILLGIQSIVIIFGVLGLLPLTGVTLPFVSYGKSSIVASFFMLGLLLSTSSNGTRDTSAVHTETKRALKWVATGLLILLIGVAGIGRLFWIQGVKADEFAGNTVETPDADGFVRPHVNPRLKAIEASIPRGSIYDRNGLALATSKPEELKALDVTRVAAGMPRGRYYPGGSSLAHLIGYVDPRCGGPVGLEKSRNGELRGFESYSTLLPIYRHTHMPNTPQLKGKDVSLTIDAKLQAKVESALVKFAGNIRDRKTGMRKHKAAAVVIDVYTGDVLACVSIPSFNPNDLTPSIWKRYNVDKDSESVLVDRSISGIYPPGSTFKIVTASAALENGLNPTYNCHHQEYRMTWRANGQRYSRKRITDLEEMRPHGLTGMAKAIRVSCNVFFAHLGIELGADRLYEMAHKFGLSRIAPPKKLAEDLPDNAYGQGVIEVTPLEMARVTAAIANGGVIMKPHFIREITLDGQSVERVEPEEMGRPLTVKNAAALRKMMADVTTIGTAKGVFKGLKVSVAGKTGSAENDHADRMPHSWFVGFAPVDDPRIAFAVVVENGGYGRDAAGPIAREIVKSAF